MVVIELKQGEHLVRKGETTKAIYIVVRGSVNLQTTYNKFTLGSGSVLGFMPAITEGYVCDYIAAEKSLIASYKYETPDDYKTIFREQPKYCYAFLRASIVKYRMIRERYLQLKEMVQSISDFVTKQYGDYELHCIEEELEQREVEAGKLAEILLPEPIEKWEIGYFNNMADLPEEELRAFYSGKEDLTIGILMQTAEIMARMVWNMDTLVEYMQTAKDVLLHEDEDLLELWYDLAMKMAVKDKSLMMVELKVKELQDFLKKTGFYTEEQIAERMKYYYAMDFKNYILKENLKEQENVNGEVAESMNRQQVLHTDFTTYIMKYAGYGEQEIANCKQLIRDYAEIAEVQNYTSEMQQIRKELTKLFYEIYEKAFLRAVHAQTISMVMKLFFNFGVLDLALAGVSHLDELMAISELLDNQYEQQKERDAEGENFCHVYTNFQWLCMVYRGEKEPSKNEFDMDYFTNLLEMRKRKEITREQENALRHDQLKKLEFEMHNMFHTNNRITYGRVTTFCPVLHEKDFTCMIDQLIVSTVTINAAVDQIREVDYSCFYRDVFFAAPEYGIDRMEIMKEVLPDVILMPNIGTRAMMWQETAGIKRDTPARFVFSVMTSGNMYEMMLETIGRYRWEICRKTQGVRWNDIREKSLTSEFYDYVQFYRKNRDLSPVAKERVKAELVHAKNNYREVFVMNYMSWMEHEVQGNLRLNKVARRIISEYVPFNREIIQKLSKNLIFKDLFVKRSAAAGKRWEKDRQLLGKYMDAGGVMTPELEAHLRYFEM